MDLETVLKLKRALLQLDPVGSMLNVSNLNGLNLTKAAALAMIENSDYTAEDIARKAMKIAADLCVYTNHNVTIELIEAIP